MIQEKEKQSQAETQEQGENWMQIAFAAQPHPAAVGGYDIGFAVVYPSIRSTGASAPAAAGAGIASVASGRSMG